jgi:UDP:flavonoid glycosyltransferase YjiC (YdhE family)
MKKTIAVLPFPLLSHYLRCASLLEHLRGDFQIVFAGGTPVADSVASRGYRTVELEHFDPQEVLECSRRFDFSWLHERAIKRVLDSQIAFLEERKPDLVVSDAAQTARMACEATATPHVALLNTYMSRYYSGWRGVPEDHPANQFAHHVPPGIFESIVRGVEKVAMWRVHRPFTRLRRARGLTRVRGYLAEYEGDRTALCDDPVIFPHGPLPPHVTRVGPAFYEPKSPSARRADPSEPPRLVVTMGSSGVWRDLSLLSDPRFHSFRIVALGSAGDEIEGPHVQRERFAEPEDLLPGAAAVICHGGNGTIYQALSYGVPVLCRPSMFEQEWNVRQFEDHGCVTRIPDRLSAEALAALITRAVGSPRVVQSVMTMESTRTSFEKIVRAMLSNAVHSEKTPNVPTERCSRLAS